MTDPPGGLKNMEGILEIKRRPWEARITQNWTKESQVGQQCSFLIGLSML